MATTPDDLRRLFLALPGVAESTHHGTMSFVVAKRFLGRIRDEGMVFALRCELDERDFLIEIEPEAFFTTDHYRGYPYVLIRLAAIDADRLAPLVERSWRMAAPKRLVAGFDNARASGC
ncbi:MmcQ/YjbR family DNA-binding protein [Mesorhizobium sp. BR1-1-16]|uniref:MmcQ/YjbR family DNA-binding protein n=1 Tax=Mesorhizobium sp. BR1-1-16 TaxID=2876653 RepID=UPI001CCB4C87|nr:MmcQ/YjbR family DNA-binding protein [Mesorhizobium sp. BR1-1-16]MBZ9936515.1 MmcQ/YjbR family DNA-binding protein [Mesorhizobium sp. BR1-1-16]